ncbi:Arylsulfatase [Anaerohalosphaera lusitana]|uniref:Arylsulfatase n=1 Tax=Anaerohalosphaera lusitana TaxID=1936003 RepID=A0A1U9NKP4_9BACT|nr:sulfatase-like hydrolase/transferase [Anaerohalosphaera lusitana]AQT68512.1 Arylsulfatase [Anaerohalosphaera lusitana]
MINLSLTRRNFLKSAGLVTTALSLPGCTSALQFGNSSRRPNIVYILADDLGYGDVGCLNPESKIKTPNIDRIAQNGIRFTDAHSGSAVCTPTRYGILTGRYSFRSRLKRGVLGGYSKPLIPKDRTTVPSYLKQHGYHSACIGKWHLGWNWPKKEDNPKQIDYSKPISGGPVDIGFDHFFGISASLDMPPYIYLNDKTPTAIPIKRTKASPSPAFWRAGPIGDDFEFVDVLPKLTRKAVDYIDDRAKQDDPFFLYFPLPAPHTPIVPTDEFKGRSGINPYADFVMQTDHTVGQVLDALERNGLTENTLVIFTSDNGCSPQANYKQLEKAGHDPSWVFRGHKADIYEGGHRIPFIAQWPAAIKPDTDTDQITCLTDLMATCADILGEELTDSEGEDSVSILPALLGKAPQPIREATVHHSINGSFSIRQGKWKLELCPGSGGWSAPRPGRAPEDAPPVQLYDLTKDISERENLAPQHPDVVKRLTNLLQKYADKGRSTPGKPQPNEGKVNIFMGIPKDRLPELTADYGIAVEN